MNGLKLTNIQIFEVKDVEDLKAIVQITFNDTLKLSGLRVFKRPEGLRLIYPVNPNSKKKFCFSFILDKEFRKEIERQVIARMENNE